MNKANLTIKQGTLWSTVFRWENAQYSYASISAITKAAPAVVTTGTHGIPDGWYVWIVGCRGMTQINAEHDGSLDDPLRPTERHKATASSATTVTFNGINSTNFTAYSSGGVLAWHTPNDLAGYTARMQIRDAVESETTLLELTTANGRIAINNTTKTITVTLTAAETADIDWDSAVYDLEMVSAGGTVTRIAQGNITISKEVTR